jgi:hypothetical protein
LKNHLLIVGLIVPFILVAGCADIEAPKASQVIKNPLGPGSVKVGMTKPQVIDVYGEPDIRGTVTSDKWGGPREEWIYRGRYSALPVSAGYLAEDLYLYFDGQNLTNISKKPLGKQEVSKDVEEIIK